MTRKCHTPGDHVTEWHRDEDVDSEGNQVNVAYEFCVTCGADVATEDDDDSL